MMTRKPPERAAVVRPRSVSDRSASAATCSADWRRTTPRVELEPAASERLDGYRDALRGANIEPRPEWIVEAAFDAGSGHLAMARLLDRGPLDAVFVASDVVAFGALGALRAAHRRVPEDISVVGFDDIPLAAFLDPPLTTVRLPTYELGHALGTALLDRIAHPAAPRRTLLPTELVVRSSTGPPRSSTVARRAH